MAGEGGYRFVSAKGGFQIAWLPALLQHRGWRLCRSPATEPRIQYNFLGFVA
jgi:hypothetical protein